LRPVVDRIKANGFKMVTAAEMPPTTQVKDDIAIVNANAAIAFAMGPEDLKVELVQVKMQTQPIQMHHLQKLLQLAAKPVRAQRLGRSRLSHSRRRNQAPTPAAKPRFVRDGPFRAPS
jgi:hypothetical protein